MDLSIFSTFGIDIAIIISIVTISELIKSFDKKEKFNKIYILLPLLLSLGFSWTITKPFQTQDYIYNCLLYTGVSSYFYSAIKKKLKSIKEKE